MNNTKLNKRHVLIYIQFLLLLLLCYLHALSAGHTCNFWPINGTFQNYNPVRRFLSGQIPYKDFTDYLGLGHLYMGSIFTSIFGGKYQASLVAFSFLTILSLSSISFWIGKSITRSNLVAVSITNLFLLVLFIQPPFFNNGIITGNQMRDALNYSLGPGNSARFVRGFIIPVFITLFYSGSKLLKWKQLFAQKYEQYVCNFAFAQLASFSVFWSNDYGFSCFVCAFCIFVWYLICKFKNIKTVLLHCWIYLTSCLIGIFLIGEIVTFGHFFSWCKNTFGIGDFQRWYYWEGASSYLYDIDLSYLTIMQLGICCIYVLKIWQSNAESNSLLRYGIPCFCNLVSYCTINEYKLLSGGLIWEVGYSILFVTLAFEAISLLVYYSQKIGIKKKVDFSLFTVILCLAWIFPAIGKEVLFSFSPKKPNSIVELGRGEISFYSDLKSAQEFIGDKKIFSTYASAQEVIQNQFQPSGIDYIIHVLGDEQRKQYMNSFRSSDFDYAVTIKEDHNDWENWIKRANWFFYRELFQGYHPVFENSYERYWEKNKNGISNSFSADSMGVSIAIHDVDSGTKKIIITTSEQVTGIADLFINYEVKKNPTSRKSRFIILRNLIVQDTQITSKNFNSLRAKNAEYIPVEIKNGYGEIILTSRPHNSTFLELIEAKCDEVIVIPGMHVEGL